MAGMNGKKKIIDPDHFAGHLNIDFYDTEHGLATSRCYGSNSFIYFTSNGGNSWTQIPCEEDNILINDVKFCTNNLAFARVQMAKFLKLL